MSNKVIFLGDLHVGVHGDSDWMYEVIRHGCQITCDYAKKHKINRLIQVGDWFDTRRAVSQRAMDFNRNVLVPMFQDAFDEIIVLVGNHDMHFKEKIHPNSCTELLGHHKGFTIIDKPTTIDIGSTKMDLFPWMCRENRSEIFEYVKNSTSTHCVGHWELSGYYFYQGIESTGDDPKFLDKYEEVYSGHFHTISNGGNVQYLGTPYTITLGDANDPRGFWVYDDSTRKLSIVYNPRTWHHRVRFDAETFSESISKYTNCTVKLVVENAVAKKGADLNKVLDGFEKVCHEFSYTYKQDHSFETDGDIKPKTTTEIIKDRVDGLDEPDEVKVRVKKIMSGLLAEASHDS